MGQKNDKRALQERVRRIFKFHGLRQVAGKKATMQIAKLDYQHLAIYTLHTRFLQADLL